MYCIQCDNKFEIKQYDELHNMCNGCLGKQRFVMEVEFDHPECDFGVLVDDTLTRLLLQYKDAKKTGWHYHLGGCPNIKIKSVEDIIKGTVIGPQTIINLLEKK